MQSRRSFGRGPWALGLLAATTSLLSAQAPAIQNGRVEVRTATAIEREMAILPRTAGEPVWVGWKVPIVEGRRGGCCTYSDNAISNFTVVGCFVDDGSSLNGRALPQIDTTRGPVALEAGTSLVVMARLIDGRVERLRTLGDDCPLDAGGRTVYWLQGITPAESVTFLDGLISRPDALIPADEQRLKNSALSAVALHRDASADAVLDRVAAAASDTAPRRSARNLLGSTRGAHGFATLKRLLDAEGNADLRRQLVSALGPSREAGVPDVLLETARKDWNENVRAEAAFWLPQRGGMKSVPDVLSLIDSDANDHVKQRAVQGLSRIQDEQITARLIQLAGSHKNAVVRKEAVSALGRSKDPKATAYLESLLK